MGRHALLLGTATFPADSTLTELPGVRQDVGQMKSLLDTAGHFDSVDTYLDLPREQFAGTLENFFGARVPGDLALLYYSGHGLMNDRDRESVFLATSDTAASQLHATAIDMDGVLRHLLNITKASQKVVLLDCCFSGAFSARGRFRGGVREEPRRGIRERGTFILTSSTHLRAAKAQGSHQPSLFTDVMLRGLRGDAGAQGDDNWITTHDLARYVQTEMARRHAHTPTESSEGVTEPIKLVVSGDSGRRERRTPSRRGAVPEDATFSADRWRRLITYYVSCMERSAQLDSFLKLNDRASYWPLPEGPESLFSGGPTSLASDAAGLARKVTSEGGSLLYGYPVMVAHHRPKPEFAPLLIADVNVSPDGELHVTLPPRPNVALARELGLSAVEIEELTQ
ncbi:MAG TPA: caspase family protein [Micromonosporaceae bacterium]